MFSQSATPTINEPSGNKVPSNRNAIKNKAEKNPHRAPNHLAPGHNRGGVCTVGLREQLRDGWASAVPGLHRKGGSTLCEHLEERQQPMQRSWVASKEKQGGRGLEWEAGRVVGSGVGVSL